VYAVEDGKAVSKPIKVVLPAGPEAAVTGVQENDVIVVDGKQNLRPGVKVIERAKEAPKEGSKPDNAPAGSAAPGAAPAPAPATGAAPAPAASK
jgi:hypothetical protein